MKRRWWVFVSAAAAFILVYALVQWTVADDGPGDPWSGIEAERDLDIIANDTLRVIVLRDPLVWEETPKGERGLAWQWIARFAAAQGLKIRAVPMDHPHTMLAALWDGRADLIAAPLFLDRTERRHYQQLAPFASATPMIVSLRPEAHESSGASMGTAMDSAALAVTSPFAHRRYSSWTPAAARRALHDSVTTEEELLTEVLLGRVPAAIVSRLRAEHEATRFPALQFEGPVGGPLPWRFVIRRHAPALRKALESWQGDERELVALARLMKDHTGTVAPPGPLRTRRMKGIANDSISPFDRYFRAHGSGLAYDWQLLAAMAWKESRFDSTVTSRKGAMGIMQIMPRTAARFGLDTSSAMEDHIRAASRYLARLDTIWLRAIPDRHQRLRFVLASYNAGPAHIIDAQRLADQLGLDPTRWEGHVERAVLLLAKPRYYLRPGMKNGYCKGSQVFNYVRGVLAAREQLGGKRKGTPSLRSE